MNMHRTFNLILYGLLTALIMTASAEVEESAFIVYCDNEGVYYARSGSTGEVIISNSDAAPVIEQALNDASTTGGTIVLREGEYLLGRPVLLDKPYTTPVNITIMGYGALLKVKSFNQCGLVFNGCENLTIQGITIEGRGDETVEVNLIRILGCKNVLLRDVKMNKGWDLLAVDSWSSAPIYSGIAPCDYSKMSDLIKLEEIKATNANRDGVYCYGDRVFMRDMYCCNNSFGIESGAKYLELDGAVLNNNYGWHGVWSWNGVDGVRLCNITANNNKYHGVCITNPTAQGKSMRNVFLQNVVCCNNGQTGILIQNQGATEEKPEAIIENVEIRDIIVKNNARLERWANFLINGTSQRNVIKNVLLNNIIIEETEGVPHNGLEIAAVENLLGNNIIVRGHPWSGIVLRDGTYKPTKDILIQGLIAESNHNGVYIYCTNSDSIHIKDYIMKNNVNDFLIISKKKGNYWSIY
ncbi:hypothetical protein J7M23_07600 [Candidatus Sumerlaeota bacterium]|nr:hypothetical protein [Candidatus Sumerlaeota bacterium]